MRNAGLEETQAEIKIAGRNINTPSTRPPSPLPAWSGDLGGLGEGVCGGETP